MGADAPAQPGQVLAGKYRIERTLGEGGHGVVLAAWHVALNERVAIKLLKPEVAEDRETVARFLREARASVRIKGEHVTRVLDVGSTATGTPYMVMEHLVGSDLSSLVEAKGWLPLSVAVDYVLQTCEALAEAHALGIVHRDIKPSNLFLTTRTDGSPCVKVLDFGISKAMETRGGSSPDLNLTQTQTVLGSPQYMAPEQMRSSRRVDGRTDIWAIGATLHELLTGRPPFDAKTMPELFAMILQDPAPRLSERRPEMPEMLEQIVAKCLEKDPERRFADVHQLARALAPFGSSMGASIVERIGRVGFNAARTSEHMLPIDAGSAPGVDLSRTDRATTKMTAAPKTRSFVIALGAVFGLVLLGAAAFVGVQQLRARSLAKTTAASASPLPPSAVSDLSPSPPASTALAPSAEPPAEEPTSTTTTTIATATASATPAKKISGDKSKPRHNGGVASAPTPSAAPPPTPPTPAPTPHPPGVASSRYD